MRGWKMSYDYSQLSKRGSIRLSKGYDGEWRVCVGPARASPFLPVSNIVMVARFGHSPTSNCLQSLYDSATAVALAVHRNGQLNSHVLMDWPQVKQRFICTVGKALTNSTTTPPEAAVAAPRLNSLYHPTDHVRVLSTSAVEHVSARQTCYVRCSSHCGHVAEKTALPARKLALESACCTK